MDEQLDIALAENLSYFRRIGHPGSLWARPGSQFDADGGQQGWSSLGAIDVSVRVGESFHSESRRTRSAVAFLLR
jgi:hypothetical protein